MTSIWRGVLPAITTPFNDDYSINHGIFAEHISWMASSGCTGIVIGGSLGEGGSLSLDEKASLIRTARKAAPAGFHVTIGIASLTTSEAVNLARMAEAEGANGLMVLPPYVYVGDWRETKAHVGAIYNATKLSCMLYNNPIAYKTDFLPEQVVEMLREHENLHAIKESTADVRRVAALRALAGPRLDILVGVDDAIVEAIAMGAVGWIAGLVNAFPQESVDLFNLAQEGRADEAFELYRWFLPLLRMDTVPKFVHLIKLVQQEVGRGRELLRPPRLTLTGKEREEALATLNQALQTKPAAARL